MHINVESWWYFLSTMATVNMILWVISVVYFHRRKALNHKNVRKWRIIMLYCSGIYVAGCAFRSFLPVFDLERLCVVDSVLSNVFLGRTIATVAELCFIILCAILLHEAGRGIDDRFAIKVSLLLIPAIVIAETCSWYAMLSTNYFGSIIEESIWALCGLLVLISLIKLTPHVKNRHRNFLSVMMLFAIGFVIFMVSVDVPMYVSRWLADSASHVEYLSLMQGLHNALQSCTVNLSSDIWRAEIPWMTLYFTTAVWVSIALPIAPNYKEVMKKKSRASRKKRAL